MDIKFQVSGRILKPVEEVFEAVVNPKSLSAYFTTGGAEGRMETGATVLWAFGDYPGKFPVTVVEVETNKRIVMRWENENDQLGETEAILEFEGLDDGTTMVRIGESGWPENQAGLDESYGNCHGWTQMTCCLKAWLEHGINLREGFYVPPADAA